MNYFKVGNNALITLINDIYPLNNKFEEHMDKEIFKINEITEK
jgi:hypothetical protein